MKLQLGIILFTGLIVGSFVGCASSYKKRSPQSDGNPLIIQNEDEALVNEWQQQRKKSFFDWPVDEARMTRGFLPKKRKPHYGVDLAAPKNTAILSSHDGTVLYVGREFKGYGRMVMIQGQKGWATIYAHLSEIDVKEGQKVQQGQIIGGMGRTGRATGVHLHFEIRKTSGPVDPLLYLPGGNAVASH